MPNLTIILDTIRKGLNNDQLSAFNRALTSDRVERLYSINSTQQTMRYKVAKIKELALEWMNTQLVLDEVLINPVLTMIIEDFRHNIKLRDQLNEYVLDKILTRELLESFLDLARKGKYSEIEYNLKTSVQDYISSHPCEKYNAHKKYCKMDLYDLISHAVRYLPGKLLYELECIYLSRNWNKFYLTIHKWLKHYELMNNTQRKQFRQERFKEPEDYQHLLLYIDYYRRTISSKRFTKMKQTIETFGFISGFHLMEELYKIYKEDENMKKLTQQVIQSNEDLVENLPKVFVTK